MSEAEFCLCIRGRSAIPPQKRSCLRLGVPASSRLSHVLPVWSSKPRCRSVASARQWFVVVESPFYDSPKPSLLALPLRPPAHWCACVHGIGLAAMRCCVAVMLGVCRRRSIQVVSSRVTWCQGHVVVRLVLRSASDCGCVSWIVMAAARCYYS
jgi:hypothetical protein